MVAAQNDNVEAVEWLLDNGAEPHARDKFGRIFLDLMSEEMLLKVNGILNKHNVNEHWQDDVQTVKQYGHVLGIGTFLKLGDRLGLGGIIPVPVNREKYTSVPIYTESWSVKKAYEELRREVDKHIERHPNAKFFSEMSKALVLTAKYASPNEVRSLKQALIDEYAAGKPIIIPVSFKNHGIGVAIYKDKLIYTDRYYGTGGKLKECTKIFNLPNIDSEIVGGLIINLCAAKSNAQLLTALKQDVDFDNPVLITGDSAQTHGTCVYTNPRSNLEGLLCVMMAESPDGSGIVSSDRIRENKLNAQAQYRDFLYVGRHEKVKELMASMIAAHAVNDLGKTQMYFSIAESYIRGHRSTKKNEGNDWKNVLEIYNRMPEPLREKFEKRNPKMVDKIKKFLAPEIPLQAAKQNTASTRVTWLARYPSVKRPQTEDILEKPGLTPSVSKTTPSKK